MIPRGSYWLRGRSATASAVILLLADEAGDGLADETGAILLA